MREFDNIQDPKKTELSELKAVEKKQIYQGTMRPQRGQKCFEYDFLTHTIQEAEYELQTVDFSQTEVTRKIIMRRNCGYTCSINKRNAIRKLEKMHGVKLKVTNL
jgi:hypothetical protein